MHYRPFISPCKNMMDASRLKSHEALATRNNECQRTIGPSMSSRNVILLSSDTLKVQRRSLENHTVLWFLFGKICLVSFSPIKSRSKILRFLPFLRLRPAMERFSIIPRKFSISGSGLYGARQVNSFFPPPPLPPP